MQAADDAFADLALTAKDRARRSLLLEYEARFQSQSQSRRASMSMSMTSTPPVLASSVAPAAAAPTVLSPFANDAVNDEDDDDDDGFDPYHHASSGDDDDDAHVDDDLARQVASLHAQIDHHLLLRRQAEQDTRPRSSTLALGLDHHLPRLKRTDRPVSCPPLASNPFSSLSSALALSATAVRTRSAPTSAFPSPSLCNAPLRSPSALSHTNAYPADNEWRPPLPNQWSANVLDDVDFLDSGALPVAASPITSGPCSPSTEAEDPLIRLARDTGPPSPTLSVMSSLAFELAGALGHDPPPLIDTVTSTSTSPTALAFDDKPIDYDNDGDQDDGDDVDPRTVPLVAHRTVLDSDTVVTTYAYPQHTNAKRASYMSTTASAAAIARNSVLSSASTSVPGSRRTSSAMRADRRPSSMLSSVSGAHRLSAAARRSGAHSVRGSVFIDTDADVIVSTSSARASVRGSFMEMRANMEMDVLADDPSVLAYDSPLDNCIPDEDQDMDEDEDALGSVQALTRWSHRFSVPPNPFVDPDEDPLTNPAGWTRGESAVDQEDHHEEEQRRRTNASLDALAAMRDNEDVHQGTSHAMLRLMGVRDPPPAATAAAHDVADGYDPDDPHAAILDPTDLGLGGLGIGSSLADDLGGGGAGLSLEEELADAELKRFSTMLDRVASQIEDLRVSDTKLTASLEKVCARCRMIQTAGPGVREYLDPCDVHGMPDELDQAPSR